MGGWGSAISWVLEKLPILTPQQRRRANIAKLRKEIKDLEAQTWTPALGSIVNIKRALLDKLLDEAANQ